MITDQVHVIELFIFLSEYTCTGWANDQRGHILDLIRRRNSKVYSFRRSWLHSNRWNRPSSQVWYHACVECCAEQLNQGWGDRAKAWILQAMVDGTQIVHHRTPLNLVLFGTCYDMFTYRYSEAYVASSVFTKPSMFVHAIYSSADLHCIPVMHISELIIDIDR